MMTYVTDWLFARLVEPSTWRGIIGFGGGLFHFSIKPDLMSGSIDLAIATIGLINIIRKEKK